MSRVLTFAKKFPTTHPKKGEPTNFLPKIGECFQETGIDPRLVHDINLAMEGNWLPKKHTIRAGNRWKKGDLFSPRVWSDKPYCSPQIEIGCDRPLVAVWEIEINCDLDFIMLEGEFLSEAAIELLAGNDGLTVDDFRAWFKKPFVGQVLVWDKNLTLAEYGG